MILLAVLAGVVAIFVWKRHIGWTELLILISFGFLLASAPAGHYPSIWLASLNTWVGHQF